MKSISPLLFLLISLGLIPWLPAQQTRETEKEWVTVSPAGVRATLIMPDQPREVRRTMTPSKDVKFTQTQLVTSVNENRTAYFFNYHDLPEEPSGNAQIRKILDDTHRTMISRLGGTSVSHNSISLSRNPGREIVFHFGNEENRMVYHARIYIRDSRMFQILVVSEEDQFSEEDANRFFDSLKFTNTPNPEKEASESDQKEKRNDSDG